MTATSSAIGFVGLGVMGEAMCRNLATKSKARVIAYDRRAEPLERLAAVGVTRAGSLAALAADADTILMCLPGGPEVEAVALGKDGLVAHARRGQTLVDMSTAPPRLMREIERQLVPRGARFADAPVARTRQAAVDGTLSIMVGGAADLFAELKPILATMGSEVTHCGAVGAGQIVKLMNNMVVFETTMALAEAISIAEASGVDGKLLFETMAKGSADSFVLRNHGMKNLVPQSYPEQAFSVRYAQKDLSYARDLAREAGVDARAADLVARLFDEAIGRGDGDRYTPVIRRGMRKPDSPKSGKG
ncbi:MAG TPA: NAD(P)-dependent oxidoreductase [Hyphomicrobiaceae bacterium]|nr:NAD(P)-dependent oxidoreductase [Hyphomicrobiaceae bacterium]